MSKSTRSTPPAGPDRRAHRGEFRDDPGARARYEADAGLTPVREWSTRVTSGGRVVLPAEVRAALGLEDGTPLRVQLGDGRVMLTPFTEVVRDIQARWRRYIPENRSVVDELIADRRAEAKRE